MNKDKYIMAIDQGTTSSRAIIVNQKGEIIARGQEEFRQIYPQSGWVEHDPNEIWNNVQEVISKAFIESGLEPKEIAAIGISNQRETTIIWDKNTGKPIYNAIVWQSRQSSDIADDLITEGYTEMIKSKTGLIIDAYFSATKIRWILDHVPGAQEKADKGELLFGTVDTWLLYQLTGGQVHVTDYTNAARTMLFNIYELDWDQEILDLLNIPRLILPEVKSNSEIYGYTQNYHFYGEAIPISGMAGDQQAALIGQRAFGEGMVKNTYGTGSFLIMNTGSKAHHSENNLITTIAYSIRGEIHYALEGSIFITGAGIQWLRDNLELFEEAKETEKMAQLAHQDSELVIVPAFTGLGAPYWNSQVRGSIFGITRGTSKEDFVESMLNSIAFQSQDIISIMMEDTGIEIGELRVDGGASFNDYLMQFQANISNLRVLRAKHIETTALGAAYLAGLGVGFWDSIEELNHYVEEGTQFVPQMGETEREKLYANWKRAVKATIYYGRIGEEDLNGKAD